MSFQGIKKSDITPQNLVVYVEGDTKEMRLGILHLMAAQGIYESVTMGHYEISRCSK